MGRGEMTAYERLKMEYFIIIFFSDTTAVCPSTIGVRLEEVPVSRHMTANFMNPINVSVCNMFYR